MNKGTTTQFAFAAAALFLAGCGKGADAKSAASPNEATAGTVKCFGVNECKGQGQCGGPEGNACAGQNECRGKGWLELSKQQCDAKGGKVL